MNRIFASTCGIALLFVTSPSRAERPFTEQKAQISGHVAYGVAMDDDDTYGLNPYGFGIGARGGYTFRPNIYVGGVFEYFFGESESTTVLLATEESSANVWLLQAEVGYDFGVSRSLVLRPKLGLGLTRLYEEVCGTAPVIGRQCPVDRSRGKFTFAPGLEIPIDLSGLFIAPEVRFNLGDDVNGFLLAFGIGGAF
jgi:hypothetical protein